MNSMQHANTPYFLGLTQDEINPGSAAVGIVPVPYDATATWKRGTADGPAAIIEASQHIELYDIETHSQPHLHGIQTHAPLVCHDSPETLTKLVRKQIEDLLDNNQLPIILGGEHSVSIGAFEAVAGRYNNLTILQIDAHADTRDTYEGSSHNHACVMARARELCDIMQVGIRSMDASEVHAIEPSRIIYAHEILSCPDKSWIDRAIAQLNQDVYITIDVDAFDSSIMHATGTPEPGGLQWSHMNDLIKKVAEIRTIVGFDVVELLPTAGLHACDFVAAKLVFRVLAETLQYRT